MAREPAALSALCVGRHAYICDHLARFFAGLGLTTRAAVGLDEALKMAAQIEPDLVICDYDLLATLSLEAWERDELLSRTAVIAVSLTRRPHEAQLLDVNGIAGFLYLPTLDRRAASKVLNAAGASSRKRHMAPQTVTSTASALETPLPVH